MSFDYKPREALIASESVPPSFFPQASATNVVCRYNYKISIPPPPFLPGTLPHSHVVFFSLTPHKHSLAPLAPHTRANGSRHTTQT